MLYQRVLVILKVMGSYKGTPSQPACPFGSIAEVELQGIELRKGSTDHQRLMKPRIKAVAKRRGTRSRCC